MTANATQNEKLPETPAIQGNVVSELESPSAYNVALNPYEHADQENKHQDQLNAQDDADVFERRRELMRSMIGIAPHDITIEEAREAHFARKGM